ncbi:MAG: hypothetical protein AB7T37_08550 [Dehalococcoidia bacterium]
MPGKNNDEQIRHPGPNVLQVSLMRVSPPRITPSVHGAARPPAGSPAADAYRQATFVLDSEVALVLKGLELEGAAAEASAGAKFRNQLVAAALSAWSRSWLCRTQALQSLQWGNYAAAIPLVRSACDFAAAKVSLLGADAAEWQQWLDDGGIGPAHELHATEFRLHPYRSAEALARYPALGSVYRQSSDLALPHFGATLLTVASESTADRVLVTFGDRDFHLGLAEMLLGWLLALGDFHLDALDAEDSPLAALPGAGSDQFHTATVAALASGTRCRMQELEVQGSNRWLVSGWRRRPGDAAHRILL